MNEVTSVIDDQSYVVRGSEIKKLDRRLDEMLSHVQWQRNFVREALYALVNDNEESLPKFIAKIGILLDHTDEMLSLIERYNLSDIAAAMEIGEMPIADSVE